MLVNTIRLWFEKQFGLNKYNNNFTDENKLFLQMTFEGKLTEVNNWDKSIETTNPFNQMLIQFEIA